MVFIVFSVSEQTQNIDDFVVVVDRGNESEMIFYIKDGDDVFAFYLGEIGVGEKFAHGNDVSKHWREGICPQNLPFRGKSWQTVATKKGCVEFRILRKVSLFRMVEQIGIKPTTSSLRTLFTPLDNQ